MGFDVDILASTSPNSDGIVQVATAFMEEYFNVSRKTLADWAKKGCPQLSHGKWDFVAVLKWRGGLEAFDEDGENSDANLVAQKLKAEIFLKQQQGQLAEIDLQKARGEVIEISEIEEVLGTVISNTKTLFLSLPPKIAPRLIGLSALSDLRHILAEHSEQFVKSKTPDAVARVFEKIISELNEAKSLMEISDTTSRLVHEILEDLSSINISDLGGSEE